MRLTFIVVVLMVSSLKALAEPSLTDLKAQKRCIPVKEDPNAFDCMVDQPDGSVKKTRFLQAVNLRKNSPVQSGKEPNKKSE